MYNNFESSYPKNASTKYATIAMFIMATLTLIGITQMIAPPYGDEPAEIHFTTQNTSRVITSH